MSKIVMTLTNPYRPDPRVAWEARTLVDAGHQVTIIAWDREAELVEHITTEGIEVTRIQNIRSTYSAGVKQSYIIPQFWSAAIKQATELSPEVIHCHDLDTLFIGAQVKKNLACKVVYDAHENYPVSLSLYLPGVATYLLTLWERWLLRFVDHTITASHRFGTELVERGVKPVTIVGNFADVRVYDSISPAQLISIRASLGWKPDDFVVAYIGGFTLDREILPLVETIKTCLDMKLLIAGDGLQRQLIEKAILGQPNIRYIGWIPASDVPVYTKLADVIYYALKPDYPGAQYNAPNSLGNALAAGRPVLANDVGDLGEIIREANCGLLLSALDPSVIASALKTLSNIDHRQDLGTNGYRFALSRSNIVLSQSKIQLIYQQLLSKSKP